MVCGYHRGCCAIYRWRVDRSQLCTNSSNQRRMHFCPNFSPSELAAHLDNLGGLPNDFEIWIGLLAASCSYALSLKAWARLIPFEDAGRAFENPQGGDAPSSQSTLFSSSLLLCFDLVYSKSVILLWCTIVRRFATWLAIRRQTPTVMAI